MRGRRLLAFVAKRLLLVPVSLFVVASLAFGLVALMPGDPAVTVLGGFATKAEVEHVHHVLGLDRPLGQRYLDYLGRLAHGDLGQSFYTGQPVASDIARYLPNTLELIVLSLGFAAILGLVLGATGAYFQRRWPDWLSSGATTAIQSVPDFVLGLVLIYAIFFVLRLVPAPVGRLSIGDAAPPTVTHFLLIDSLLGGDWAVLASALGHSVLPVVTLGVVYSAYFAKTARTSLAQAMNSPQVEFARACGLRERTVLGYALLTARTPLLTYGAILFGALIGGEAIIETIFSWRGVGQWALEAVLKLDVPVIQGFIIVAGLATLLIYLILDVLVAILDPRVSYG